MVSATQSVGKAQSWLPTRKTRHDPSIADSPRLLTVQILQSCAVHGRWGRQSVTARFTRRLYRQIADKSLSGELPLRIAKELPGASGFHDDRGQLCLGMCALCAAHGLPPRRTAGLASKPSVFVEITMNSTPVRSGHAARLLHLGRGIRTNVGDNVCKQRSPARLW